MNIVIRIPSIPHEKGYDSFFIHSLANSVSSLGYAGWWTNWMSVFGLYPYSYASAVPFSLSGISQTTGISMEITILLFCVSLGIFSIFSSYVLGSIFYEDFISKYIFSILFSISAGTINLTTWEITTRAQFLVFFTFLIYLLFKFFNSSKKYLPLYLTTVAFLLATHHYVYFALFFSIFILFTFLVFRFKPKKEIKFFSHLVSPDHLYIIALVSTFIIPFIFSGDLGLITEGSRYQWIFSIIMISIRNLGPMLPLSIGAIVYLSSKKSKTYKEWSLLICLFPVVLFAYDKTYGYIFTYIFLTIFCVQGLGNIIKNYSPNKKIVLICLVLFLILNTSFSCFFAHWRVGMGGGYSEWYMREETYTTGKWIKQNLDPNSTAIGNGYETGRMFSSYGGRPILYHSDITNYMNKLITLDESKIKKNSVYSKEFYFDNPYILTGVSTSDGVLKWALNFPITDGRIKDFIKKNNFYYFYEDSVSYNTFVGSLPANKNRIYNSGRMRIWIL
ncbi:hypothetical protein [Methanosarcina mazei]|uniref:hypothetical protein n=1 Tax=Methanosarcina mazei TaxID=2209 RepID=UPI0012D3C2EA|nr:hypothetical protein [Methanosarcina mazei]